MTGLALAAFYLSSLPRSSETLGWSGSPTVVSLSAKPPMLVHIVLDEQWGIGGLRAAGDTATASFIKDFYIRHRFEVFEAAYSRWAYTSRSIRSLMSLGQPVEIDSALMPYQFRMRVNPYFEHLEQDGYMIHVFQSTFMDFCHSERVVVESCSVVPSNTIANVGLLPGPWKRRAFLAARYFLNQNSHVYLRLRGKRDDYIWRSSFTGRGLREVEDVIRFVEQTTSRGTALVFHWLLPHRPVEVDANCVVLADPYRRVGYDEGDIQDSVYRDRMATVDGQVRCVHRELESLLEAIDRATGKDSAIVVIHGDHGSRLNRVAPIGLAGMTSQQLNSMFSTLLAIRRPGHAGHIRHEPVPVQPFLWELIDRHFKGEVGSEWRHFVQAAEDAISPGDTIRVLTPSEMIWFQPQ